MLHCFGTAVCCVKSVIDRQIGKLQDTMVVWGPKTDDVFRLLVNGFGPSSHTSMTLAVSALSTIVLFIFFHFFSFLQVGESPSRRRPAPCGRQTSSPGAAAGIRPPWDRHLCERLLHAACQHAQGMGQRGGLVLFQGGDQGVALALAAAAVPLDVSRLAFIALAPRLRLAAGGPALALLYPPCVCLKCCASLYAIPREPRRHPVCPMSTIHLLASLQVRTRCLRPVTRLLWVSWPLSVCAAHKVLPRGWYMGNDPRRRLSYVCAHRIAQAVNVESFACPAPPTPTF